MKRRLFAGLLRHSARSRSVIASVGLAYVMTGVGCTDGKVFIATASDYADYRATRVHPAFDDRVAAAGRYLDRHPHGRYRDEVKEYFAKAEPLYFERHEKTIAGLEGYLEALPKGPHAEEARDALDDLNGRARKPDAMLAGAAATARRLEANKRSREQARGELREWLERSMSRAVFDAPLESGPKEFLVPFSLRLPSPKCAPIEGAAEGVVRRCKKLLSLPYVIPTHHTYEERALTFDVSVETDAGSRPRKIVIAGPDLFARLQETSAKEAVDQGDTDRRIDSLEGASREVTAAFESAVSDDATCVQDVAAPDLVHLRCKGVDVMATLGTKEASDDVVVIEPAP